MAWHDLYGPADRSRLDAAFEFQYRHDRIGHTLHTWLASGWCFFATWSATVVEFATAPLLVYTVIRVLNTWRVWRVFWTRPVVVLFCLLAAWDLVTLAWSPDRAEGLNDLAKIRFGATSWALWVVMDRRRLLIASLAAGFLVGNLVQAVDWYGSTFDIAAIDWRPEHDRYAGWWAPAVGGSLLAAAFGLHLPTAVWGRGRIRWLAMAALAATTAGLLATGTRSGWIAAAGLICVAGVIGIARWARTPRTVGSWRWKAGSLIAVGLGVALAAGVWMTIGDSIARRAREGWAEVHAAVTRGDYSTWTGGRIDMARLALQAVTEHPVRGIGMGGFRAWTNQERKERGDRIRRRTGAPDPPYPHAHNTLLHAAATTGLPGALLLVAIGAALLRGAFHREQLGAGGLGSYEAAPGFAVLGLALVSPFDTVHVNAPTCAVLAILVAMCLMPPPRTPPEFAHPSR